MANGRLRLYSYIVTYDTGFSPNPFFGFCTLACCKPAIRRTAEVGGTLGLSPKAKGNRVVYFMRVKERLTCDQTDVLLSSESGGNLF
jgi:putative DNA base modification enzyme with NMAD domain